MAMHHSERAWWWRRYSQAQGLSLKKKFPSFNYKVKVGFTLVYSNSYREYVLEQYLPPLGKKYVSGNHLCRLKLPLNLE